MTWWFGTNVNNLVLFFARSRASFLGNIRYFLYIWSPDSRFSSNIIWIESSKLTQMLLLLNQRPQAFVCHAMVGHRALEQSAGGDCVNRRVLSSPLCGKSDHTVNIQRPGSVVKTLLNRGWQSESYKWRVLPKLAVYVAQSSVVRQALLGCWCMESIMSYLAESPALPPKPPQT